MDDPNLGEDLPPPSPMDDPATVSWGLGISDSDLKKLKTGFQSQCMEDHWNIGVNISDVNDNITITISRSWTGIERFILHVVESTTNGGHKIQSITWAQNKGKARISEEQAKIEVVILCRQMLGCVFLDVPQLDVSLLWKHPGSYVDTKTFLQNFYKK